MRFARSALQVVTHILPPEVITSDEIELQLQPAYERLGLRQGRLEMITGIRQRRFWQSAQPPSYGSIRAGRKALEVAGCQPKDIEVLIHCAVSRDYLEPATASVVHDGLDMPASTLNFDLSNACLGALTSMQVLAGMIESRQIKRGMIVVSESARNVVENTVKMLNADTTLTRRSLKDSFATLTLGSSASAIIMCDQELAEVKHPIVGGISLADTKHSALCTGGDEQSAGAGLLLKTRAADLMEAGTQVAKQTWEELKAELEWSNATPDLICTHQVTSRHRDGLYNDLGLDIAKDISTFPFLGNCGAASLPVTLSYAQQEGKLQSGDQVALMGIGSGINCSMFGLQW